MIEAVVAEVEEPVAEESDEPRWRTVVELVS
jgi:hypothetical protein